MTRSLKLLLLSFAVCALFGLILVIYQESPAKAPGDRNNTWHTKPGTPSSLQIIFVHGVLSNSEECWRSPQGKFWPDLAADSLNPKPAIFLGGYYTSIDSGPLKVQDAAKSLFNELNRSTSDTPTPLTAERILFVAHSLGGLVVRQMLVEYQDFFSKKKIGILLAASPTRGSGWATQFSFLTRLFANRMVAQLELFSEFALDLDRRFSKMLRRTRDENWIVGVELFETVAIGPKPLSLLFGPIVESNPQPPYFDDPVKIGGVNHFSIVKPNSKRDPVNVALVDFVNVFEAKFPSKEAVVLSRLSTIRDLSVEFAKRLAETQNSDGGFRGLGQLDKTDPSGEWTTSKNILALALVDPHLYREKLITALNWLIDPRRVIDGGVPDVGYYGYTSSPKFPCVESTAWTAIALTRLLRLQDPSITKTAEPNHKNCVRWLIANQNKDGGWGSFGASDSLGSRTYPTCMSILALLECFSMEDDMNMSKVLKAAADYLLTTAGPNGWGSVRGETAELFSTSMAVLCLSRMAERNIVNRIRCNQLIEAWKGNYRAGKLRKQSYTEYPTFIAPMVGQQPREYEWYTWLFAASAATDFNVGIEDSLQEMTSLNVNWNGKPWHYAVSIYAAEFFRQRFASTALVKP